MSESRSAITTLLLTGQSNQWHNWKISSAALERILDEAGGFDIDVLVTPEPGGDFSGFEPEWSAYDLVVLDYEGDDWPESTKRNFTDYVASGGGLLVYHATDNAFPDWPEFNEMIGVGGWGGRDESAGPKLRWREGRVVRDDSPGVAMHPNPFEFAVETRAPEHPIMKGLPKAWLHARDELYSQLRGPARNVEVLATGRADPAEIENGTGEHEPVLMAIRYGKGRVFHTTLGHVGAKDETTPDALRCVGFVETTLRGAEWAATGAVARAVPGDFPGRERPSLRS